MSLFIIIGLIAKSSYSNQEKLLHESLKNKALTIFNLIVDMRHWNASYDGVYLKTEELKPNPYLTPNHIKSNNNETLVWVNPAFMTRQIAEIASKREGFKLKITSNKLINKDNAPDQFESKILTYFENNPDIPYSWKIDNNNFKFIGALKTTKECLVCHASQGYKVGDIRGGISMSFDIENELTKFSGIYSGNQKIFFFLIIAAIGVILTLFIHEFQSKASKNEISKLNRDLENKIQELDELNQNLSDKVQDEVSKLRDKEKLLIQQSKLATLGEMMGNIAHQWRQPISAVSTIMMNIKWTAISAGVDKKFIDERINEANDQLSYMSDTIDDFRNFFKPDKEKEIFNVSQSINKSILILIDSLNFNNIKLNIKMDDSIQIFGYPNEFSQVVLNLISNAKDILLERNIQNPQINIDLYQHKKNMLLTIIDNGKGIESKTIDKIFEPYFTTKDANGTGIGLYIAKEIIEKHMQGTLNVENTEIGACFSIKIPIKEKIND